MQRGGLALRLARWTWPVVGLWITVALFAWAGANGSLLFEQEIITGLVYVVLVVGLYIFIGNSGVVSFGHVCFMAIGAYTSAIATIPAPQKHVLLPRLPGFLADLSTSTLGGALLGGLAAAFVALLIGLPLMRLSGISAGIATFSALVILRVVLSNANTITRGNEAMLGFPIDTKIENALMWALVTIGVAYVFQSSRFGLRLRASREDLVAARSLGVAVLLERLLAFTLSAFFMGVGGALYGHQLGAFSPDAFYVQITFFTLAMLVVGGINSLAGAVFGTIALSVVSEVLIRSQQGLDLAGWRVTTPTGTREVVLGLILVAILIGRPRGITGGREIAWPGDWRWWRQRRRDSDQSAPAVASSD